MSRVYTVVVFLILFVASAVSAKVEFSVAPEFGMISGTTEYELDIEFNFIDTTGSTPANVAWRLTSLLEFPLDTKIGGLTFKLNPELYKTSWAVSGGYYTSFTNPTEKMLDSDWEGESPGFPYTKWSYTESDAELKMNIAELDVSYCFYQREKITFSMLLGGRYQKIENDVIGIDGWQRPFDSVNYEFSDPIYFTLYQDTLVGTYEITFKQIKIGVVTDLQLSEKLSSRIQTAFAPVFFKDIDDHILRNKLSTADGDGKGFIGSLDLKYDFIQNDKLSNMFILLSSSFNYMNAKGSQTQEWYGDDQATPGVDDTGEIIRGIPHSIKSRQFKIGLRFGMTF